MKNAIYEIIKWAERITYKIFKKQIDKDVYEEITEIKKRIAEQNAKELNYCIKFCRQFNENCLNCNPNKEIK